MFTGIELTDKGVAADGATMCAGARDRSGMDIPLSADHFGHIGVNSCIRLGKALEKYNIAWLEDMIPWQYTELLKKITDAVDIPTLHRRGYLSEGGFIELVQESCGGHSASRSRDLGRHSRDQENRRYGSGVRGGDGDALCGDPGVLHGERALRRGDREFLVLENHSVDVPWWSDLVDGVEKPIVNKGFITVPEKPGLGITLNDDVMKQHLLEPGYFEPTPEWDKERS